MEEEKKNFCRCLYYSVNGLSRLITKIADDCFAPTKLTSSYAFLLMIVNNRNGISPKEISLIMQLSPSTVTRLVDKMVIKGLLDRTFNKKNSLIFSTEKSKELDPLIRQCWRNLYIAYSEVLGEEVSKKLTEDIYASYNILEEKFNLI
ncbi:MAG: MarR family transcriptional regulator [Candidatus Sericytochromatia bacterium]